ncbi:MAG: methionyl-tRNA formyltransferase [Candidatus Marinimicrobia bacterium]|nr:methionyl-tRNA formyltransferase [Candidatus Neomarinimicrobiota bacterium]|tara:strand:+ start:26053 stop:26991 length:939 start_codon:yes stop_codon:yes gene_type:complete
MSNKSIKIIFFGNTEFSNPVLLKCAQSYNVCSVVTNPSKKMGRGQKLVDTPVKILSNDHNLEVIECDNLLDKEFVKKLEDINPDLFVVVAYKILPKSLLSIPKYGAINLHSSLLPKYRGAAPIQRAILNHEKMTGVSTFLIEPRVDTGKILEQTQCDINDSDNYGSLSAKLSNIGADLVVSSIEKYLTKEIKPYLQDESLATLAPKIMKEEFLINWDKMASDIHAQIKAFSPYPGAYTFLDGKRIKFFESELINNQSSRQSGEVDNITNDFFDIACSIGSLRVYKVQMEGKKMMPAKDFILGMPTLKGSRFS